MRIALDMQSVLHERPSGFFTYGLGLLRGFAALEERPELVLLAGRKSRGHRGWLGGVDEALGARWAGTVLKPRHLAAWWRLAGWPALQSLAGEFEVYHCIHHLMGPARGKARVLTVHDLRRYRYPEFYAGSRLGPFERAVRQADHFIAISEATKRDLQEFFGIGEDRIDVVYHGGPLPVDDLGNNDVETRELLGRLGLRAGRYFVAFSSYDRRKNVGGIVEAFRRARERLGQEVRLVVIGRLGPEGRAAVESAEGVVAPGPVGEVEGLLRGSLALVYASLYEGFGLPILEAMGAGTAVIASDCSSMPEVVGEAGVLVDPRDAAGMAAAMVRVASDGQERERLVAAGYERCRQFSWAWAAAETMAVYRKVAVR